jgi:hypothetical protein
MALLVSVCAGPSSAESVLERVLASFGNPMLNGVFVNAAENAFHPLSVDPAYAVIDGTISNTIYGVSIPEITSDVYAVEALSTVSIFEVDSEDALAIGGVNTGQIILDQIEDITTGIATGANMVLDQVVTTTTNASSMQIAQLGGSFDSAVLVLNMSANEAIVRGRVENQITNVSASIGQITATAIGAVNTGAIQSGVSSIVSEITGL